LKKKKKKVKSFNTTLIELWVGNLAEVPDGCRRTATYIVTWKQVWKTRREQLTYNVSLTTPSTQPAPWVTKSLALGPTAEVDEISNNGNYDSTWQNVGDVHENVEGQEMKLGIIKQI